MWQPIVSQAPTPRHERTHVHTPSATAECSCTRCDRTASAGSVNAHHIVRWRRLSRLTTVSASGGAASRPAGGPLTTSSCKHVSVLARGKHCLVDMSLHVWLTDRHDRHGAAPSDPSPTGKQLYTYKRAPDSLRTHMHKSKHIRARVCTHKITATCTNHGTRKQRHGNTLTRKHI